jgi:hypothetical protein
VAWCSWADLGCPDTANIRVAQSRCSLKFRASAGPQLVHCPTSVVPYWSIFSKWGLTDDPDQNYTPPYPDRPKPDPRGCALEERH